MSGRPTVDVRITLTIEVTPPGQPPIEVEARYDDPDFPAAGYSSRGLHPALVSHLDETAHELYDQLRAALVERGLG